jgi:hypothetical protein
MKTLKLVLSALVISASLVGTLSGCASINSVSLTSIPATRSNVVRSEAKRMVFLGFNFNNDFIDTMADDLKNQCPNGQVRGLLTKDETVMYFLFFLYEYRVSATGYCVKKPAVALIDPSHADAK